MNRDWLVYQKLVAQVYQELDPAAVVIHDDKLIGLKTKIQRQIDVSIRANVAGLPILIIVQVKDLKSPADVNVVGEFISVIDDVGANKGVIVCSGGFTKAARHYAKHAGVAVCKASDAESKKWKLDVTVPLIWIENPLRMEGNFTVTAPRSNPELELDPNFMKWPLSEDGGNTRSTLEARFIESWNAARISRVPDIWHEYKLENTNLKILLGSDDYWCGVSGGLRYFPERRAWLGQFTFKQLRAITDYNENTVQIKATVSRSDLPLARSAKWVKLENPDEYIASNPLSLQIEHDILDFGQLVNRDLSITLIP